MFLLLLRHVPRIGAWFTKQASLALYQNLNLQTLVLAPLVLVLLLLPAVFSTQKPKPRNAAETVPQRVGYTPTGYHPTTSWSLDR